MATFKILICADSLTKIIEAIKKDKRENKDKQNEKKHVANNRSVNKPKTKGRSSH